MFFGGDPFEHFAHAGMGGGGGRGGGGRAPSKAVDTTKLYETLGVSSSLLLLGATAAPCSFAFLSTFPSFKYPMNLVGRCGNADDIAFRSSTSSHLVT